MKDFSILNPPAAFVEIGQGSLRAWTEDRGGEWPLERAPDGKLTAGCREKLISGLSEFLRRKTWQPRGRALCGLSLHGVSLRRVPLPVSAGQELENVLRLQIEKEFPLGPDDLAWGWREVTGGSQREAVIFAARKGLVEDYAAILGAAGLNPDFTLSALARELLCPAPNAPHALLEIGNKQMEWVTFENGVPTQARIFPFEATLPETVLKYAGTGTTYLSGNATLPAAIGEMLSAQTNYRRLEVPVGDGLSPAIAGLRKSLAENSPLPWLRSKPKKTKAAVDLLHRDHRPLLYRVAILLLLLCLLPYVEALTLKPLLARKLETFKADRQRFVSVVGPELEFLQALKQSQPPYLDAIYVLSKAAAPGMHMDSLAITQKGAITLKATLQNAQQVMDFRAKLIDSGFFAGITVEEQSITQQKVNVRMSAQWKPAASRPAIKVNSPASDAKPPGHAAMAMAVSTPQ